MAPGEECFQVTDNLGKVIILGLTFNKSIGSEAVKKFIINGMEINFSIDIYKDLFDVYDYLLTIILYTTCSPLLRKMMV